MRTRAVNVLSVVAVPTQQTQVCRESQLDNDRVPAPTCNPVSLRLAGIVAPRIGGTVTLRVINRQKLWGFLTAARTSMTVVSKHHSFVSLRLFPLPTKKVGSPLLGRFPQVGAGLNNTGWTQRLTARFGGTLCTETGSFALHLPSFLSCGSHLIHLMCTGRIT
jgi:hypothetical protein